jgi:hypothetical protein
MTTKLAARIGVGARMVAVILKCREKRERQPENAI